MDKKTAIDKISKCLALAKSSEPHEAAAALRQAQKLMEKFGIEHPEILAAGVGEAFAKSSASKKPTRYEVHLASVICDVFACELMFSRQLSKSQLVIEGGYVFIAAAPIPDIAAYTFSVLRRQLAKARTAYIATALKRYRKNKTAAADLFCVGWVRAVHSQISAMHQTREQTEAIAAYKRVNYAESTKLKPRETQMTTSGDHRQHMVKGYIEGKDVSLNRGVGRDQQTLIGA